METDYYFYIWVAVTVISSATFIGLILVSYKDHERKQKR